MKRLSVFFDAVSHSLFPGILWTTCSLLASVTGSHGQVSADSMQQRYQQQTFEPHSFNRDTWREATQALDYSDQRTNKEEKEPDVQKPPQWLSISDQTVRLIAFMILFAILIIILLKAFGVSIFRSRKKIKEENKFSLASPDDPIPESALEQFLKEALQRKDFRLAVRIYYLMVIKELTRRKLISWQREKTNSQYLMELVHQQEHYGNFRDITFIFERIWYGERVLDENGFREVSTRFKNFLSALSSGS